MGVIPSVGSVQPPHLLLEQPLALERCAVLGLQLPVGSSSLAQGLFGDFQPRRKLGVLLEDRCGARLGGHAENYGHLEKLALLSAVTESLEL